MTKEEKELLQKLLEKREKKSPSFEFSKKIFIFVSAISLILFIFTLYIVYSTKDTSPLNYLIPAIFGAYATVIGFYFNKAKIENKIKLMKLYKVEPQNDDFREE